MLRSLIAGSSLFVAQINVKIHVARFIPSRSFDERLGRCFIHSQMKENHLTMEEKAVKNTEFLLPDVKSASVGEQAETEKRKRKSEDEPGTNGGGKKLRPGKRYIPPPQKRNLGFFFRQKNFDETSYYFENGLRKVYPYYFDFTSYCKSRWMGKSLHEVFKSECSPEMMEYYEKAIEEGRIKLNETPVKDLTVILRKDDRLRSTVHRHELPVVGTPLKILVDDGEVLVVDKPASIPVYPCGRYRYNTVIFILGKEHGISELDTVHRLDRLTSGVLLFARTLETSNKLYQMRRARQLKTEYVCRVEGEFPEGELTCKEPISVVHYKIGPCRVDAKGKECRTVFQRLSFNGKTSVVRCLPLTGRTHQIRVHLQYLGFPILNDPTYGSLAWGPHRGKRGVVEKSDEELLQALLVKHRSREDSNLPDLLDDSTRVANVSEKSSEKTDKSSSLSEPVEIKETIHPNMTKTSAEEALNSTKSPNKADGAPRKTPAETRDHLCSECKLVRPDPTNKELVMYLHALRYKGHGFEYSTQLPVWAKEDWVETE